MKNSIKSLIIFLIVMGLDTHVLSLHGFSVLSLILLVTFNGIASASMVLIAEK